MNLLGTEIVDYKVTPAKAHVTVDELVAQPLRNHFTRARLRWSVPRAPSRQ
jgi:hypothetical protein